MNVTRIRPGRYLVAPGDGKSWWVTRNDHARPVYWIVERADGRGSQVDTFATDTLTEAKVSLQERADAQVGSPPTADAPIGHS